MRRRTASIGLLVVAAAIAVLAIPATPAFAFGCGADPTAATTSLPRTGASVLTTVAVALGLIAIGAVVIGAASGRVHWPGIRPALAGVALLAAGVLYTPSPALAAGARPHQSICATKVPSVGAGNGSLPSTLPAVVPESPLPVALPISGIGLLAVFVLVRTRRTSPTG